MCVVGLFIDASSEDMGDGHLSVLEISCSPIIPSQGQTSINRVPAVSDLLTI